MILFVIGQLFINFKRGLVVSPFYHYGMYSEVINPQPAYDVYEILVDNKLLKAEDFSIQQWDKIVMPIKYFHSQDSMNVLYKKDVKRLMQQLRISTASSKFVTHIDSLQFLNYYKPYLFNILGRKINSVDIASSLYAFDGKQLRRTTLVNSPE